MCAHYGSWEWIFILQNYVKHKGYAVYKRLANKYFDRLVKRIRAKYNSHLITTKETFTILNELRKKVNLPLMDLYQTNHLKHIRLSIGMNLWV